MRKLVHLLCGIAAGLLAAPAMAQESITDSGLYVTFGIGGSDGSFVESSYSQFTSTADLTETFQSDFSLTGIAAIGYQWAPAEAPSGFRMELEGSYRLSPLIHYSTSAGVIAPAEGDLETIGIMANVYVDLNLGPSLAPYFGGGLGGVRATRRDIIIGGVPFTGKFSHTTAWQIMAGIGYKITPGTILGLDYRRVELQDFGWPDLPETDINIQYNEILLTLRLVG